MTVSKLIAAPLAYSKPGQEAKVFLLSFENGERGEYYAKTGIMPFTLGQDINYLLENSLLPGKPMNVKINSLNGVTPKPEGAAKDAHNSALALCKSALEAGFMPAEIKDLYADLYSFFYHFKPYANV